jgi:hypothetical protein
LKLHQFSTVRKDRLFYDRFEYCLGFYLDEVSCLRQLDHASIDDVMERRKQWREIARQRWVNGRQKHGIIMSRRHHKEITKKTVADLHAVADQLLNTPAEFKLVVSSNQGYVYTNNLSLIDQLSNMPELTCKSYTQAQITRPKNTIALKNPQHKFRTYLKLLKLTPQQKDYLMDFLHSQQHIRISPALSVWFDQPFNRTQDYFFVDHNSESWLTMLSLVHSGIVRKTMHIIPTK